jgi:IS66 Orf2 like protein
MCSDQASGQDKLIFFWDDTGLCLFAERLEHGVFRCPKIEDGVMRFPVAQLSALLEFFASQSSTEHGTIPLAASSYPSSQQASRRIRPGSETLLSDLPRFRKQAAAQIELLISLLDATEDTDTDTQFR